MAAHSSTHAIEVANSALYPVLQLFIGRKLSMKLSDSQFSRQKDFCAIVDALSHLLKSGVIDQFDYEKACSLMRKKYKPLVRFIS